MDELYFSGFILHLLESFEGSTPQIDVPTLEKSSLMSIELVHAN